MILPALLLATLARASDISPAQGRELGQVAVMLKYVAGDYPNVVKNGRVVDEKEFREMRSFSTLARVRVAGLGLAGGPARDLAAGLAALAREVDHRAPAAAVRQRIEVLTALLGTGFGISGRFAPDGPPDLREGERVFRQNCAVCHGLTGNGAGPAAARLKPRPANLTDREFMRMESPFSVFSTVSVGVADAAMPAWGNYLSDREIWNVVFYVWRFHLDDASVRAGRRVWARHRDAAPAGDAFLQQSDDDLAAAFPPALAAADRRALGDFLRAEPGIVLVRRADDTRVADALGECRRGLARVRELATSGRREEALQASVEAYLNGFEKLEADLGARAPGLKRDMEERFGRLREELQAGASGDRVTASLDAIEQGLAQSGRVAETGLSGLAALGQSFVIIVREGFEVILVLAALATYLIRVGHRDRTIWLYGGAGAAIVMSLGVAWLAQWALAMTPASQELLEGITMLLAAGVLFWMSHWILSRVQAEKWNRYIQQTASRAMKAGNLWTLGGVGFLIVFREGVETVLFYQSLAFGSPGAGHQIWIGFGVGCIALLLVSLAMFQLGLRLPLRPFFVATSGLLYVLVFSFTGSGIHELQAGGILPATAWRWLPSFPLLGIYPTLESLIPQAVIAVIGLFGLRAIRRTRGSAQPMTAAMPPVPTQEQLLAIQDLAARLAARLDAAPPTGEHTDNEFRNLVRQLVAATKQGDHES